MGRLSNRVVFVTGASAGIGEACARAFAREGARLLLAARRLERLEERRGALRALGASDVRILALDVRDEGAVTGAIDGLPAAWSEIEVLVGNAGLSRGLDKVQEGLVSDWDEMIDTNVKGLLYVTRAVVRGMVARGRGTVLHVGSIAGRQVYPGGAVYCASKYAVRAITEGLRIDTLGTGVRVGEIVPGLVNTEFSTVRFHGDRERADRTYVGMTPLAAEDVAEVAVFMATRPDHVTLGEVTILPTDQAGVRDVHRRG